jgi:hypothetical protein
VSGGGALLRGVQVAYTLHQRDNFVWLGNGFAVRMQSTGNIRLVDYLVFGRSHWMRYYIPLEVELCQDLLFHFRSTVLERAF